MDDHPTCVTSNSPNLQQRQPSNSSNSTRRRLIRGRRLYSLTTTRGCFIILLTVLTVTQLLVSLLRIDSLLLTVLPVVVQAQSDSWLESIGHGSKNAPIGSSTTDSPKPTPTSSSSSSSNNEQTLLWSDEFDETTGYNYDHTIQQHPNPQYWNRDVGVGTWGWGNEEYQYYTDATSLNNAYVQNGNLHIVAREEIYDPIHHPTTYFTSARLKTDQKMMVKYGTIIAKIQIPNLVSGLWAGFWTLGENFAQVNWPYSGEIDIMEIGDGYSLSEGNGNKRVISAVHMSKDDGTYYYNYTWTEARPVDLNETYHYYKLEWTPYSIQMYVDDYRTHYFDIDLNGECNYGCEELHQPHFLLLNLAVGGLYTLQQTDVRSPERITATFPATMKVDYIRIYDNGYTKVYLPNTTPPTTAAPITTAPTAIPTNKPTIIPPTNVPVSLPPPTIVPTTESPPTTRPKPQKTDKPSSEPQQQQPKQQPSTNNTTFPTTTNTSRTNAPIRPPPTRTPTIREGDKIFNTKSPSDDIDRPSIVSSSFSWYMTTTITITNIFIIIMMSI